MAFDKEYIKGYWKEVRRQAWKNAHAKGAIVALLIALLVLIISIAITGLLLMAGIIQYPFFKDNINANFITGFSQLVVSLSCVFLSYLIALRKIPPEINFEKEETIRDLKKEIQLLKEPERLKVRQWFFKVEQDHYYTWIENYNNKKIVDIEANIQMVHMIKSKHEGHKNGYMRRLAPPQRGNILNETEIRAGNNIKVCIASAIFSNKKVIFNDEKLFFKDFGRAIFKVFVEVSGRYEGEIDYKKNQFDVDIEVDLQKKYIGLAGLREFAEIISGVSPKNEKK